MKKTNPAICHYFRYFNPHSLGGVETHIQSLSQSLSKQFQFTILCDEEFGLPVQEKKSYARIMRIGPAKKSGGLIQKIHGNILDEFSREKSKSTFLQQNPPDLLHVHGPVGFSGTVAAGSLLSPLYRKQSWVQSKLPKLMTFHGLPSIVLAQKPGIFSPSLAKAWKKVEEKNINDSNRVIGVDRYVIKELEARGLSDNCTFIPNGINFSQFKPQPQKKVQSLFQKKFNINLSTYQTVFLYLNRLSFEKGIQKILEINRLPPNSLFLIAGEGAYQSEVEEKCRIHPQFQYLGNIPNELTPVLFNSVDYLVSPLLHPGATRTHIEALACHLPVVSTTLFDHYPLIHQQNGVLLRPDESLESALFNLPKDFSFPKKPLAEFDLRVTSKKIAKIYNELIQ